VSATIYCRDAKISAEADIDFIANLFNHSFSYSSDSRTCWKLCSWCSSIVSTSTLILIHDILFYSFATVIKLNAVSYFYWVRCWWVICAELFLWYNFSCHLWYVISQLPRLVNGFEILVITFIISISIQVFAITFMVTRLTYDWSTALQNF